MNLQGNTAFLAQKASRGSAITLLEKQHLKRDQT
jgi:hypothetical protein